MEKAEGKVMVGSTLDHRVKDRSPEISVWCSHFNAAGSNQANAAALNADSFVLYADKPFQEGTPLFVRVRSFPRETAGQLMSMAVRSVSIMEVKWCCKTDETSNQRAYAMGVAYLHTYG
jgi:hypothetical protein